MEIRLKAQGDSRSQKLREEMVRRQIVRRGIRDERLLDVLRTVPRHCFIPDEQQTCAYQDNALPIGRGQTISQPYIVALMTELLEIKTTDMVLEIGTGSGYQTAVLAALAKDVYSVEILQPFFENASETLRRLGVSNAHLRCQDGYLGWPEHAPYDKIIVTAAPPAIAKIWVDQMKAGGKLVAPVGVVSQALLIVTKTPSGVQEQFSIPVRFVPMVGEEGCEEPQRASEPE